MIETDSKLRFTIESQPRVAALVRLGGPKAGRLNQLRLDINENTVGFPSRVIEEMFLASLSRWPSEQEKEVALSALVEDRVVGTQDLQWALINSVDFFFNY